MDLLMDINGTGDLVFANGATPRTYIEADVVAQRLAIHLRTFRAEWFLDEPYGVPWFEILGTKRSKQQVDSILQREVLSVQGVREIVSWTSDINNVNRNYSCQFTVRTTNGELTDQIIVNSPTI